MRLYSKEEIKKIINDVRASEKLLSKDPDRLCASAKELVDNLLCFKAYIIPEKREEWCDLINGIMYEVKLNVPPIVSSNPKLFSRIIKSIESHDEKLSNEILMYINTGKIMEVIETTGLDQAVSMFKELDIPEWALVDIAYDILRFSMFGTDFIDATCPELINKPKFKREYEKQSQYLKTRLNLENRLTHAIKIKIALEEYKEYCVNYYYWDCDNTTEKLNERKNRLNRLGDEYLKSIVNNTFNFAGYLLQYMKSENKTYQNRIFTSIPYSESDVISLGCTGGHIADRLYEVELNGNASWISYHLLGFILEGLSIEEDYDIEETFEDNIGCTYSYPKLSFSMKLNDFNNCFSEFFEDRAAVLSYKE